MAVKSGVRLLLMATLLAAACSSPPQLARRYKRVVTAAGVPLTISVGISSLPIAAPQAVRLVALSDRAQGAYVEQLGRMVTNPAELRSALAKPLNPESPQSEFEDRLEFARRLVITVARSATDPANYRPADRLAWSELTLTIKNPCIRFTGWSLAQTEYTSIDAGILTTSQNRSVGGQLGVNAAASPVPASATINLSQQSTIAQELALRQRVEALTPVLRPHQIEIIREGFAGADLTGNTIFDLTAIYDKRADGCSTNEERFVTALKLFNRKGEPLPSRKAALTEQTIRLVANPEDAVAEVGLQCIVRRVLAGNQTIAEGDDVVAFQGCNLSPDSTPQVLLPAEVFATRIWIIREAASPRRILESRSDTDQEAHPLEFESRQMAEDLRRWLQQNRSASIGRHQKLGLGLELRPPCSPHCSWLEVVRYQ